MYNIHFKNTEEKIKIHIQDNGIMLNGKLTPMPDILYLNKEELNVLFNGKSFQVSVEQIDKEKKEISLCVNNNKYVLNIQESIDQLLLKMGINLLNQQKIEPIKAPMPGLVLKILVTEGQQLKKGDPVLILEAMKMENVFKAPSDAIVKTIKVQEQKAVEKGEVLIELD